VTFRIRSSASQRFGGRANERHDGDEERHMRPILEHAYQGGSVRARRDEGNDNQDDAKAEHEGPRPTEIPDVRRDSCQQQQVSICRPQDSAEETREHDAY